MTSHPESPAPLGGRIGRLTGLFLAVVAVGFVAARILGGGDEPAPVAPEAAGVGAVAPEIIAEMFDGSTWTLSGHFAEDGRPLVLNLWASWCVPCRKEFPELSAFADAHPEIAVVGVAVDDTEDAARALAEELEPTYPVGIDPTNRTTRLLPVFGLPVTFIIGTDGTITHQLNGGITRTDLEEILG